MSRKVKVKRVKRAFVPEVAKASIEVEDSSKEKERVGVQASGKASAAKVYKSSDFDKIYELSKNGEYRQYLIERAIDPTVKPSRRVWVVEDVASTEKKAASISRALLRKKIAEYVASKESEWRVSHTHDQKVAENAVFKITAKTTDEEIDSWIGNAKNIRASLIDKPPAKMPKFKLNKDDKEYPLFRIRLQKITVELEELGLK